MYAIIPPAPFYDKWLGRTIYRIPSDGVDFGVTDLVGEPVSMSHHFRAGRNFTNEVGLRKQFSNFDIVDRLEGRWIYGGIVFAHFGHFLTESVHRISEALKILEDVKGILFLKAPHKGEISYDPLSFGYIDDVLKDYFGVPAGSVRFLDRPVLVDDLRFVTQMQQLGVSLESGYLDELGVLEERYARTKLSSYSAGPEKIFLSRAKYLSYGRALGVGSIEQVLRGNGFEIIYPEDLKISDQINLLRQAKIVIAEAGSAVHMFDILGRQTCDLYILSRRGYDAAYWKGLYSRRVRQVQVFEQVMPIHLYTGHNPGVGHSLMDPGRLVSFLARLGIGLVEADFLDSLRRETLLDMERLGICLP